MTIQARPEDAIFELCKSLVSDDKCFALVAPEGETGPFIIYQRVDSENFRDINGPSGLAQATIQIDSYAQGYNTVKDLADSIETTLDGYRGTVYYGDNSPQDSIDIGGISLQNDVDILDQEDEPVLYRVSAVYLVTYDK